MRRAGLFGRRRTSHERIESSLVWIFCAPRSGSTWVLNLLRAHPRVVGIDEPLIGTHLGASRAQMVVADANPLATIFDTESRRPSYVFSEAYGSVWRPLLRELILERLAAEVDGIVRQKGIKRPVTVVKEPHGAEGAGLLVELLPGTRMLFLLRDGRDVVDSVLDAALTRWSAATPNAPAEQRMSIIEDAASRWLARVRALRLAFDRLPDERRLIVRYEDVRSRTSLELRRIHDWLGLEATDADREQLVEALAFENVPPEKKGSGKFVRAASPGLWRENLTQKEQDRLHSIMGAELGRFGYAV